METPKTRVTAEHLHGILEDAFTRIRSADCHACSIPQPRELPHEASVGINWWLGPLPECEHGCASFIGWLWQQYGGRYELADDEP